MPFQDFKEYNDAQFRDMDRQNRTILYGDVQPASTSAEQNYSPALKSGLETDRWGARARSTLDGDAFFRGAYGDAVIPVRIPDATTRTARYARAIDPLDDVNAAYLAADARISEPVSIRDEVERAAQEYSSRRQRVGGSSTMGYGVSRQELPYAKRIQEMADRVLATRNNTGSAVRDGSAVSPVDIPSSGAKPNNKDSSPPDFITTLNSGIEGISSQTEFNALDGWDENPFM